MSPEALGVGLIVGGLVAGSTLALGGGSSKASALTESSATKAATTTAGETAARSSTVLKTLASTGKIASVGGVFQTLGSAGTITIGALLVASLVGAGLVYASSVSQTGQMADGSTVVQPETQGKITTQTVRTDDGDCELNMTIDNGTLIVDAAVHSGKCWFTYNRVGDEPRGEQRVSTGWMIVTRVSGDYDFVLRSTKGEKRGTITL
ncbi:hypothetical protein G7066_14650 [Leucobacter coleopterorum]|uniref:Uncharacterized protein n=1 Tax=Leucobacter coleopterorum TaxID=2714933 RepID=A0ABX6K2S5_9MICO|nr:hypothetical protein [Leucobacter coleopterorum]QIM19504.1 hypothetical protein G7066_14650 [Leucobacter coleopterorum]